MIACVKGPRKARKETWNRTASLSHVGQFKGSVNTVSPVLQKSSLRFHLLDHLKAAASTDSHEDQASAKHPQLWRRPRTRPKPSRPPPRSPWSPSRSWTCRTGTQRALFNSPRAGISSSSYQSCPAFRKIKMDTDSGPAVYRRPNPQKTRHVRGRRIASSGNIQASRPRFSACLGTGRTTERPCGAADAFFIALAATR